MRVAMNGEEWGGPLVAKSLGERFALAFHAGTIERVDDGDFPTCPFGLKKGSSRAPRAAHAAVVDAGVFGC